MAASPKSWLDRVWLVWFSLQPLVILCVDAVSLYPTHLYVPPSAPLHLLQQLRSFYIATYNDPIVQWSLATASPHSSWIHLFLLIELAFSLPTVLYAIYRLGVTKKGTSGPEELWFMLYAFEVAFTTLVCLYDIGHWDPDVYSAEQKSVFLFNLYGPYFLVPTLIFVDMASRILARFRAADRAAQGKKTQ